MRYAAKTGIADVSTALRNPALSIVFVSSIGIAFTSLQTPQPLLHLDASQTPGSLTADNHGASRQDIADNGPTAAFAAIGLPVSPSGEDRLAKTYPMFGAKPLELAVRSPVPNDNSLASENILKPKAPDVGVELIETSVEVQGAFVPASPPAQTGPGLKQGLRSTSPIGSDNGVIIRSDAKPSLASVLPPTKVDAIGLQSSALSKLPEISSALRAALTSAALPDQKADLADASSDIRPVVSVDALQWMLATPGRDSAQKSRTSLAVPPVADTDDRKESTDVMAVRQESTPKQPEASDALVPANGEKSAEPTKDQIIAELAPALDNSRTTRRTKILKPQQAVSDDRAAVWMPGKDRKTDQRPADEVAFSVPVQINGVVAGNVILRILNDPSHEPQTVHDNFWLSLGDILDVLRPKMDAERYGWLRNSGSADKLVTLNALRSLGIKVGFGRDGNLIPG